MYRNMQRSYVEFQLFADHLAYGNPQSKSILHITLQNIDLSRNLAAILPALPLPQTSAITDDEGIWK